MSPGKRIETVIRKHWRNQQEAAKAVGMGQASISAIINDQRLPPFRLLESLVQETGVDAQWLLTGEGVPFPYEEPPQEEQLPIANCLLPSSPEKHHEHLVGWIALRAPGYQEGGYAVAARDAMTDELAQLLGYEPTDLLIIEADPSLWTRNIQILNGKPCAIRVQVGDAEQISIQIVRIDETQSPPGLRSESVRQTRYRLQLDAEAKQQMKEFGREFRDPIFMDAPHPNQISENSSISIGEIVGVVIALYRTI